MNTRKLIIASVVFGCTVLMSGQLYAETINGTWGADDLIGTSDNDTIYGHKGADKLVGQGGNDTIYGGKHADELWGGSGDDKLWGQFGNDDIVGGTGSDRIGGGSGWDDCVDPIKEVSEHLGLAVDADIIVGGCEASN